jgi:hypothetical protein
MNAPLDDWEDELGRLIAHRLRSRAIERLESGEWTGADFEDAIEAAERRATPRQRELLWEALTADLALSEAASRSSRGEDSSLI